MPKGGFREGAGRPKVKASEQRSVRVGTGVTPAEFEKLKKKAKAADLKMPNYVHKRLTGKP